MPYDPYKPLAMIAGTGDLPRLILQARQQSPSETYIIAIKDQTPLALTAQHPHGWFRIGAVGAMLDALQQRGIQQITMAGRITRPPLPHLFPDAQGRALLKVLGSSFMKGDNQLLSRIMTFLEERGLQVIGAHEIGASLTEQAGILTATYPEPVYYEDAKYGINLLQAIAPYDIGQATIVQEGHIIGIEGMEGTHALIERCALLTAPDARKPILVKIPKITQDLRADMPSVGVHTVEALAQAGFAGMFIAADHTLLLDKDAMIARANEYGLFIETLAITT